MPISRLRVARDPALAIVVRIFVDAVAERWGVGETDRDDLRLAASELFAGSVEAGDGDAVAFTISAEDGTVTLAADGVDPLGASESPDPDAWGGRVDLIHALFPQAEVGDVVRITVSGG
jgi:hypothetical protein